MDIIWTAVLGVIQGATEFLPVSSSGHLAAAQMYLANEARAVRLGNRPLTLEILLHVATFFAVVIFYRQAVFEGLKGVFRGAGGLARGRFSEMIKKDDSVNLATAVVAGTIPTGVLGLLLRRQAEMVSASPTSLGLAFLGTACMLLATLWWPGGKRRLSWRIALLIGAVQGIAVLPGISRSGVTIAAGLAVGLEREDAVRFSFLLSLPAIIGAAALELDMESLTSDHNLFAYLVGGAAAFVVGLFALYLLVRLVRGGRLWLFAPYVALMGTVSILFL
jgi:undecaprenyl-diphosphatase